MLALRKTLKLALPSTPENSPNSPNSAGKVGEEVPGTARYMYHSPVRYRLTFATSDRTSLYRAAEHAVEHARYILSEATVGRKIRAFVQAEIRAASDIIVVGRCISTLSHTLLARPGKHFRSENASDDLLTQTNTSVAATTSPSSAATYSTQPWMLRRRLEEVKEIIKQRKVQDIFLQRLIRAAEIVLEVRECVERSENVASLNGMEALLSDTTFGTSKSRRSSLATTLQETTNDARLKSTATKFHVATEGAPLIRYLCSTEVDEALSNARARELVTSSIKELRRSARDVRAKGSSEAVVALASAVERGRRHGLHQHDSPRVRAHFNRCESLLSGVKSTLELLRQGVQRQNQRDMREGLEKAYKMGLSDNCVEIQAAKSGLKK